MDGLSSASSNGSWRGHAIDQQVKLRPVAARFLINPTYGEEIYDWWACAGRPIVAGFVEIQRRPRSDKAVQLVFYTLPVRAGERDANGIDGGSRR